MSTSKPLKHAARRPVDGDPLDLTSESARADALHDTEFARRVVRRMAELGCGKTELMATAALSRQTLENLLRPGLSANVRRRHMPSVRTLLCLARALKVHPYWLIEGMVADARVSLHLQALQQGDRAGYVEDPDLPDGCLVAPGAHFRKTFAAQNLSGQPWRGRKVVCWDAHVDFAALDAGGRAQPVGRLIPDVQAHPFGDVLPDQVITDSLGFTAPLTEGPAVSYWQVVNADGSLCYEETAGLWVMVWVSPHGQAFEMFPSALGQVAATHV
jgi:hypothetical protein